jgi:peptide/nickel transport system ATP-binding protein
MSATLLEVKNLTVEFATRRAVLTAIDDVSFSIAQAELRVVKFCFQVEESTI